MISLEEQLPTTTECEEFHRALLDIIGAETDFIMLIWNFGFENKDLIEYRKKIRIG